MDLESNGAFNNSKYFYEFDLDRNLSQNFLIDSAEALIFCKRSRRHFVERAVCAYVERSRESRVDDSEFSCNASSSESNTIKASLACGDSPLTTLHGATFPQAHRWFGNPSHCDPLSLRTRSRHPRQRRWRARDACHAPGREPNRRRDLEAL